MIPTHRERLRVGTVEEARDAAIVKLVRDLCAQRRAIEVDLKILAGGTP